jgi:dipicolinate synthase subunit B
VKYAGLKIGWGVTGSYCSIDPFLKVAFSLRDEGAELTSFASSSLFNTNTRFGLGDSWRAKMKELARGNLVTTIVDAEPYGPEKQLDIMVIAPLTGSSMAKLALGITDTPILMATKATLRNNKPVLLAVSTNDALGNNAENLGKLLRTRGIYFVPFRQDAPTNKPRSLVAVASLLSEALLEAIAGRQLQPILAEKTGG